MMPAHLATITPVTATARADDWREQAACADPSVDPEWWFSTKSDERDLAKRICGACPVVDKCADYIQEVRPTHGIWAGESAESSTRHLSRDQRALYRVLQEAKSLTHATTLSGLSRDQLRHRVRQNPQVIKDAYEDCKARGLALNRTRLPLTEADKQYRWAVIETALTKHEAAITLGISRYYILTWIQQNGTEQQAADWRALPTKEATPNV